MAEFVEVIKRRNQMCNSHNACDKCALKQSAEFGDCDILMVRQPEEAEKIIMAWAAEHPEPKYPSWNEAWKQLFPDAFTSIHSATNAAAPCLQYFMKDCRYEGCNECREQPIPADIAEKLGIKPLDG